MIYEIAQKSIIGGREQQQDSLTVISESDKIFATVCDGMGGHEHGHAASNTATDTMTKLYLSKTAEDPYPEFFINAIDILDEKVLSLKSPEMRRLSAGTTIITAVISADNLFWMSVGDSRLYIVRKGSIVCVTRDHNYFLSLNQMMENGAIEKATYDDEAVKGERLISFIGMGGVQIFDVNDTPFKLLPGDTVLLCSDGLYKAVNDDEILRLVSNNNPAAAMCALFDDSNKTFADNTTCVIIKCNNEVSL